MSDTLNKILSNVRRMYPKGRAWWLPDGAEVPFVTEDGLDDFTTEGGESFVTENGEGGILIRLHKALALSEEQAVADALSIQDALLPDNDNFTLQDARQWYRRLGIYDSGLVLLADMKLAIGQKYYGRGLNRLRQNYLYIETQLRNAGFDVRLYENRFGSSGSRYAKTVSEVLGYAVGDADLDAFYLDEVELDSTYAAYGVTKIVQYIEEDKDAAFAFGANLRSTFFVAGATITTFATVDINRKIEFRQLLISLKPLQAAGYLFITYV